MRSYTATLVVNFDAEDDEDTQAVARLTMVDLLSSDIVIEVEEIAPDDERPEPMDMSGSTRGVER